MGEIVVKGLTKDYGNGKGIFDLDFEIEKGEVFGYLGPNGAGKTTTIRNLMGFGNPTRGECKISGLDCRRDSAVIERNLGYLPGEMAFFDDMTGNEFLKFMGEMRSCKQADYVKMKELIAFFELDPSGKIKKMSKGMKQKLGIVTAFMHNPPILILDEPTSGLDPLMQNKFIGLILEEKKQGKTILMSSHSFEEVERTCDRVGIIRSGRFVAIQTVEALKTQKRKLYSVSLTDKAEADKFADEDLEVVMQNGNVVTVAVSGGLKSFTTALDKHKIISLDVVTQSLEEVFMAYYGDDTTSNFHEKGGESDA